MRAATAHRTPTTAPQRLAFLRAEVGKSIAARFMRFGLAYGFGQTLHRECRELLLRGAEPPLPRYPSGRSTHPP